MNIETPKNYSDSEVVKAVQVKKAVHSNATEEKVQVKKTVKVNRDVGIVEA